MLPRGALDRVPASLCKVYLVSRHFVALVVLLLFRAIAVRRLLLRGALWIKLL